MVNKKKNLIIGVVEGLSFKKLEPFIVSLKRTNFKGDLILFVSKISILTKNKLRKYGARLIEFKKEYPYIKCDNKYSKKFLRFHKKYMHLYLKRHFIYLFYLSQYGKKYSKIMLTDVRDVIFQKNPFDFKFNEGIHCFLEDKGRTISSNYSNAKAVKQAFDKNTLKEIGHYYISCAGVVIGNFVSIISYLEKIISSIRKDAKTSCLYGSIDQAIHNYLIYKNKLDNLNLIENEKGPVLHLAIRRKPIRINKEGYIINEKGYIINIIHQYDRVRYMSKQIIKNLSHWKYWKYTKSYL